MPKIVPRRVWWNPGTGDDITGYRVYMSPEGEPFSYENPNYVDVPGINPREILVPNAFPDYPWVEDHVYKFNITTVDEQGNESDPLELSAPFDFVAPGPPIGGGISAA